VFSPLALLVPLATLATLVDESLFARRWSARVGSSRRRTETMESLMSRPAEVCAWP